MFDTSHPCVDQILFSNLTPVVNFDDLEYFDLLNPDAKKDTSSAEYSVPETYSCTVPEQEAQVPVTPEKQAVPMASEKDTPHTTLHPGHPNGQTDTLTPSDSGSVLRNGHPPDGSPPRSKTLELFMASFYLGNSSPEVVSEDGQSPSSSRKRTAKAASLPDSVTDDERPFGGEKLDDETRAHLKRKQSPVSSTSIPANSSTTKHTRERSSIPRPVSVMSQARSDHTKIPLPTDSVPVLDAELRRFENSVSPVEKDSLVNPVQVEHGSVAKAVSGDTIPPLASPSTKTSLGVSNGDAGKPLKNGPDMEKLPTVASAGSLCDTTQMSESVDASFGGIPTQETFFVQPPTPPTPPPTIPRPRLVLVDEVFQVLCPSDIKPAWYKASVHFTVGLQTRPQRRGWYELIVPGLPRLNAFDRGFLHLDIPDNLGLEIRTTHFNTHKLDQGCLEAQFPSDRTTLFIPLRLCDSQFYGFLRDFTINQTIRSKVTADHHDSTSCIVEYTAVCSLGLFERTFWTEKCGFYLYIHDGPAGDYTCHLEKPKAKFNILQLTLDPESEVEMARLLVICTPSNLDIFVIKWEMRLPRAEAGRWMPHITALPKGYRVEEKLQSRYLEAAKDEQDVVRCGVKARIVTPESSNVVAEENSNVVASYGVTPKGSNKKKAFMPLVMKLFLLFLFMALFLLLQPLTYSIRLNDGVLCGGLGQKVLDTFCENSKLYVVKSPREMLGLSHPELIPPAPVAPEVTEFFVPMENFDPFPSPVSEEIDRRPPEPVRRPWTPFTFRDHVDYWLGWKGPLPDD